MEMVVAKEEQRANEVIPSLDVSRFVGDDHHLVLSGLISLADKVTEMFASSNARKRKMVQTAVNAIRKSATSRMSKLHQEMSNIQDLTTSVQEEWTNYIQKLSSPELKELLTVARAKLILADFVLHKMITSSEFDGIFAIELMRVQMLLNVRAWNVLLLGSCLGFVR